MTHYYHSTNGLHGLVDTVDSQPRRRRSLRQRLIGVVPSDIHSSFPGVPTVSTPTSTVDLSIFPCTISLVYVYHHVYHRKSIIIIDIPGPAPYVPSELEARNYYYGLESRPRLIARSIGRSPQVRRHSWNASS